ncbi:MAG TPA: hypothetical protein VG651_12780 [Stellaceae bacterium]|nr:hypothetical protein [Stellaceae bacterium]
MSTIPQSNSEELSGDALIQRLADVLFSRKGSRGLSRADCEESARYQVERMGADYANETIRRYSPQPPPPASQAAPVAPQPKTAWQPPLPASQPNEWGTGNTHIPTEEDNKWWAAVNAERAARREQRQEPAASEREGRARRQRSDAPQAVRPNFPIVQMTGGELGRWIDEAEDYLLAHDPGVYGYGDMVARIAPGPITTAEGKENAALRIVQINTQHMIERFCNVCQFCTWDARRGDWVAKTCPPSIAQGYIERVGMRRLRPLLGITSSQIFRRDSTILTQPGYDEASCLFYDPCGMAFSAIPERLSQDEAKAALDSVAELYAEIPFVDQASLSVVLSANFCAVARYAVRGLPMHAFTATAAGSGKSMCCDIPAVLATGSPAPAISIGTDPEELKKSLGAELSAGAAVVSLDNCESPIGGELVNQILTQERVKVRVLGMSRMTEIPRGALLLANGNGLEIVGDLVRRCIVATIDPQSETPWLRTFETENPVQRVRRERGKYVSALLTVLRAYTQAGCPDRPIPLGSFEEWSALIRGAIIWCGYADPCTTMEHLRVADHKRANLSAVLHRWHASLGSDELTVGDVIGRATDRSQGQFMFSEFREALLDVAGDGGVINSRRLGRWLRRNQGTMADGLRIEEGKFQRGSQYWRVMKLE